MRPSPHLSEQSLIELHLHESASEAALLDHLESCPQCAAESESIAETLRVFSAGTVPAVDLEQQWRRLRPLLSPLGPPLDRPGRPFRWSLWTPALAGVAIALLLAVLLALTSKPAHQAPGGPIAASVRPGPLSSSPVDSQIAQQLESAERLLTVVNHTAGPLDPATREQAHDLLVKNAVYIQRAREEGDSGTAAVLDDLDRVLTNIDHASSADDSGWHLRLQWNTRGLLLDIRMLRQNDRLE